MKKCYAGCGILKKEHSNIKKKIPFPADATR
jgi:hypothetical protein